MSLSGEKLQQFYRQMLLCRRFEERCAQVYVQEKIHGFCHLYIGQEAVAVGAIGALKPTDYVITTYRDHCHPLIMGTEPRAVMAELYGKATGVSKGKGGSMHLFDVGRGFFGGHGIVGAHVPLAAGMAFASKYLGEDRVTICMLGDAAVAQGAFHEALNLVGVWGLPAIFIIENNIYGMGTHYKRAIAGDMARKGEAYGLESGTYDAMDITTSYERVAQAVELARTEHRGTVLEARCYRYRGHSMSDPGKYRTKEEVEEQRKRDPLVTTKQLLVEQHGVPEEWFKALEKEIRAIVDDAERFAEESPWPSDEELYTDVVI